MRAIELRLGRDMPRWGGSGWDPVWRNLLAGLGIYGDHRGLSRKEKEQMVQDELARLGGTLVEVGFREIIMEFPDLESRTQFLLVWS